ncbi:MAG TPA: FHA domain-containing protein [Pirellulales bacterium]|jgi:pSer/pThr/pTyr-binding forkhead associated (FHA) protein
MRSWEFKYKALITIGRAEEQDVIISDPYVSRCHAELRFAAGKWTLFSLGRYGVTIRGELISEAPIDGETVFRLGSGGPSVRFEPKSVDNTNRMTMMFDSTVAENTFEVDQAKLRREVGEIAEGSYFQELKERAKQLRERKI